MRLSAGFLWFLVITAGALVGVVLLANTAPASCRDADAQRASHLIGQAEVGYAAILKGDPASECAQDGMHRVFREKCQRADYLLSEGARTQAGKLYTAMLEADLPEFNHRTGPHWEVRCAGRGLAQLEKTPEPVIGPRGPKGDRGPQGPPGRVDVHIHKGAHHGGR
jgi:hypothetical protein